MKKGKKERKIKMLCTVSLITVLMSHSKWDCIALEILKLSCKLTGYLMLMLVFWVAMLCGLVVRYQYFGSTYCLYLQGWRWSSMLFQKTNNDIFITVRTSNILEVTYFLQTYFLLNATNGEEIFTLTWKKFLPYRSLL
jgi:hypothetical protein